jgi:hypothetical protein
MLFYSAKQPSKEIVLHHREHADGYEYDGLDRQELN